MTAVGTAVKHMQFYCSLWKEQFLTVRSTCISTTFKVAVFRSFIICAVANFYADQNFLSKRNFDSNGGQLDYIILVLM